MEDDEDPGGREECAARSDDPRQTVYLLPLEEETDWNVGTEPDIGILPIGY